MAEPLTDADLAAMRARCAAATPGPWGGRPLSSTIRSGGGDRHIGTIRDDADRAFIIAAREDLPRLLDEVARLRAMLGTAAPAPPRPVAES